MLSTKYHSHGCVIMEEEKKRNIISKIKNLFINEDAKRYLKMRYELGKEEGIRLKEKHENYLKRNRDDNI